MSRLCYIKIIKTRSRFVSSFAWFFKRRSKASSCMKVKRYAGEYLRTDDDLTEWSESSLVRFSSALGSLCRDGGNKKMHGLFRHPRNIRKNPAFRLSHDLGRCHEIRYLRFQLQLDFYRESVIKSSEVFLSFNPSLFFNNNRIKCFCTANVPSLFFAFYSIFCRILKGNKDHSSEFEVSSQSVIKIKLMNSAWKQSLLENSSSIRKAKREIIALG